jgi:hypothetical protein
MLRTLSVAAVLAASVTAFALPAAADTTVKVDVTGLPAPQAHARIVQAAKTACRIEFRNSTTFEQYYQWSGCINDSVATAESQLRATASTASTANASVVAGR